MQVERTAAPSTHISFSAATTIEFGSHAYLGVYGQLVSVSPAYRETFH